MSRLMAQNGEQHDFLEEIVYNSQEEEDQWPESQSSVQNAAPLTETPKRPPLPKIYGRTKVFHLNMLLTGRDVTKESQSPYLRRTVGAQNIRPLRQILKLSIS